MELFPLDLESLGFAKCKGLVNGKPGYEITTGFVISSTYEVAPLTVDTSYH